MSSVSKNERKRKAEPIDREHKNVKIMKQLNQTGCKTHGEAHLLKDVRSGDLVCAECGFVVEDRMICEDAEWRNYADDSMATKWMKSRAGDAENPFLSADFNLGTMIKVVGGKKNSSNDQSYAGNITNQFKRRSVDNALNHAFKVIETMGDRINLASSVLYLAKKLYSQVYRKKNFKGNIMEISDPKTAACLYIACRLEQCSRSKSEICAIYNVNKKNLSAAITRILKCEDVELPNAQSIEMIDRFTGHMQMTKAERKQARSIAERIELYRQNKRALPEEIAGAAIYLVAVRTKGEDIYDIYLFDFEKCLQKPNISIGCDFLILQLNSFPKAMQSCKRSSMKFARWSALHRTKSTPSFA